MKTGVTLRAHQNAEVQGNEIPAIQRRIRPWKEILDTHCVFCCRDRRRGCGLSHKWVWVREGEAEESSALSLGFLCYEANALSPLQRVAKLIISRIYANTDCNSN